MTMVGRSSTSCGADPRINNITNKGAKAWISIAKNNQFVNKINQYYECKVKSQFQADWLVWGQRRNFICLQRLI
jgi:hypothetical protein